MTDRLEILMEMEIIGKNLKDETSENAALLIKFIQKLERISKELYDRDLIFISYFLNTLIEDIWSNIAVDSSYREEISDDEKDIFLSGLGEQIEKLAISITENDFSKCHETCGDMIEGYLKVVEVFETKIENHLKNCIAEYGSVDFE